MYRTEFELTVVVPVSRMAGNLELLKKWIWLAQHKPICVVVIHDWRDQETELELVGFIESLPNENVNFISGKFGSPGITRNQAMEYIHTDWVAYWDSDDFPNLDTVLDAIKQSGNEDEVLIGSFETKNFVNGNTCEHILPFEWKLSVATNPGLWRMIFKTEILQNLAFSDLLMGEDQLFIAELDIFNRRVRVFQDIFYTYQIMFEQQATRRPTSLMDLKRCLIYFGEAIATTADLNKKYYQVMYLKQIISAIKYLLLRDKLFALGKLLHFAKVNGVVRTLRFLARIRNGR
jgi:hypothetical protein